MKNREKVLNTNLYDLLVKMNNRLNCEFCIIDLISDKESPLCIADCDECIQEWLNAEVRNNEQRRNGSWSGA